MKRSCRKDNNEWFEWKGEEAQIAADQNDTKTLYRIVKDLSGNGGASDVPVKDKQGTVLTTTEQKSTQWVEHVKEVLNQANPPTLYNFENEIGQQELDVDMYDISETEVERAIRKLKNNKLSG